MVQALLSGVAGIKAHQTRMNVIGNNLANVNTTAYKGSRINFEDTFAQTIQSAQAPSGNRAGANASQAGHGVIVSGADVDMGQGSLSATNRTTDVAVQGAGMLMTGNGGRIGYTRDGAMDMDSAGNLVHRASGERVLGWTSDVVTGQINTSNPVTSTSFLNIPLGRALAAQATSAIDVTGNLDAREAVNATPPVAPSTAIKESTIQVFDSLGTGHDLTVQFHKSNTNEWTWNLGNVANATGVGSGVVTFNANGTPTLGSTGSVTVTPTNTGASPMTIAIDFSSISQLSSNSTFQASSQNGYQAGELQNFSIGAEGVITGSFTNGLARSIGQLAITSFPNANGLVQLGSNLYGISVNSGTPSVGGAGSGGRGTINAGFLEQSNVDITTEFTDLIITQRGFQANTKIVTTVDEMLQELINMKR